MSGKSDVGSLPGVAEEDNAKARSQEAMQDNFHFQVHIVVNPAGAADVTVSGGITPPPARHTHTANPQGCRTNVPLQENVYRTHHHRLLEAAHLPSRSTSPRASRYIKNNAHPYGTGCQQQTVNGCLSNAGPCDGHVPAAEPSAEQMRAFLRSHPDFLERFVMDEVELEQLERWMIRSTQRSKKRPDAPGTGGKNGRKTSLSRWKFCVHADKRQMLQELTKSLQQRPTKAHVLWELAGCICSAIGADGYRLYLADRGDPENLGLYLGQDTRLDNGDAIIEKVGPGLTIPVYVGRTREPLRLSRSEADPRFPDSLPDKTESTHALYQPVVQTDGQLAAVVELWRRDPFHEEDEEIASSYLVWGGIALHYAQLYLSMDKQRKLNDFLLAVVKSIFQDMVSMDTLIMKIMNFAQRLVDADRASLFLVDNKNKELFARIFDIGIASDDVSSGGSSTGGGDSGGEEAPVSKLPTSTEIRFPLGTGIAGQVANTGEVLNIPDAYCDPRFNRTIDQLTGYRTKSILCMPIFIRGNVIGVVQMVNKRSGDFVKEDEEAFEMFAVYCGLALHHAKLYDKIARSEQKYRVALEVLSYHNTCSEIEVAKATEKPIPEAIPGVDDYYFSVFKLDDFQKAVHAIYMFKDLFGLSRFDTESLIRFTLTVRKNYRRVPYHNWTHGFSVANSMYSLIKHSQNAFKSNECLALYIASLCHDLDHRGKNNKFMLDTESPLAAIYSTSTMEHHHFNQTVTILQQKGHNIFSKLNSWEYKHVLSYVKHCILATDLALFFPNKAKLAQLVVEQSFSWGDIEHRLLIQAIAMTACDLSASAKPWEVQVKTVKVIFEEFYEQGDAERAAGRTPIPMMDRNQPDQQASSQGDAEKLAGHVPSPLMDRDRKCELGAIQVGFLTGICIPCYSLLYRLIPETKPMLDQCQANLERWRQIDEETKRQKEESGGVDALTFLDQVLESTEMNVHKKLKNEEKSEVVPEEKQSTIAEGTVITDEGQEEQTNGSASTGEESEVKDGAQISERAEISGDMEEDNEAARNELKGVSTGEEKQKTEKEVIPAVIAVENSNTNEKKNEDVNAEEENLANENESQVDETTVNNAENKEEEVDVSVIIQELTDEDMDMGMRGTILVSDAKVVHHTHSPLPSLET